MKILNVFDLDGCLADSSHRYKLADNGKIDLQYWRQNSHKVMLDKPLPLIYTYKQGLRCPNTTTIIATARTWCNNSSLWVLTHLGAPDVLIHRRGENDKRGGAAMKINGIKRLLDTSQFATINVFEDNKQYLDEIAGAFPGQARPHFVASNQGH